MLLEVRDRMAYVTMNQTEKLNAINKEMLGDLFEAWAGRAFCPPGPGLWTWMFPPTEKFPGWNNSELERVLMGMLVLPIRRSLPQQQLVSTA